MSALLPLLKLGETFARLSISGYEFDLILKFRIWVSGLHIIGADIFRNFALISPKSCGFVNLKVSELLQNEGFSDFSNTKFWNIF